LVRKALLIFLLAVLPFQFVWGAAAGYCQHEQGVDVSHFGHHAHKHAGKVGKAADVSGEKSEQVGGDDADCIACHMSCVTFVSETQFLLSADQVAHEVPTVRRDHSRLLVPSIERPKWAELT
jgi:hypothetical protein